MPGEKTETPVMTGPKALRQHPVLPPQATLSPCATQSPLHAKITGL